MRIMTSISEQQIADRGRALEDSGSLSASLLCLEFTNTAKWHATAIPEETLHSYRDLVLWARRSRLLTADESDYLIAMSNERARLAQQILAWAIELREALYRIFQSVLAQTTPDAHDLALVNEALPSAYASAELIFDDNAFQLQWRNDASGLDCMLWPILRSAVRLLTTLDLTRMGQCADDRGCGYIFYDTSRNRTRRWCDMNTCGNRAKAHRHYVRHRKVGRAVTRTSAAGSGNGTGAPQAGV